jgi:hypothetical protein
MSSTSQRLNDSGILFGRHGSLTSERSSIQHHRSSAEASEIEREVNKHKRFQQNTGSSSIDKNYDPEAMKRQMLQAHLQKLVN